MASKTLKIQKIKNGTVIDHLPSGTAFGICRLLGIDNRSGENTVALLSSVCSKANGKKDVIKVENVKLSEKDVERVCLLAPKATINIVNDFKVVKKFKPTLPKQVVGIAKCLDPRCISNLPLEPIVPKFSVTKDGLKCQYCDNLIKTCNIVKALKCG